MVIYCIKGVALGRWFEDIDGGVTHIGVYDVKGAFPGLWLNGADYKLHIQGLDRGTWEMVRALSVGLKGRIWLDKFTTRLQSYKIGLNQGSVDAPHRFVLSRDDLRALLVGESGEGLLSLGQGQERVNVGHYEYVDDNIAVAPPMVGLTPAFQEVDNYSFRYATVIAPNKTHVVVLNGREVGKVAWQLGGREGVDIHQTVVLGEILSRKLLDCSDQVDMVCKRADAAALSLHYLGLAEGVCKHKPTSRLIDSLVYSVLRSGLAFSILSKEEADKVRAVIARFAKSMIGVPASVSSQVILAELGWDSETVLLMRERLGLYHALSAEGSGPQVRAILGWRKDHVDQGDERGLTAWFKATLLNLGLEGYWEERLIREETKDTWKKLVKERIWEWQSEEWRRWVAVNGPRNNGLHLSMPEWGWDEGTNFLNTGTARQISLKAAFKWGAANLWGNKVGLAYKKHPSHNCRFCSDRFGLGALLGERGHQETERHLVFECLDPAIMGLARKLKEGINRLMGSAQWYEDLAQGMGVLMGAPLEGSPQEVRSMIDTLVKSYLEGLEDLFITRGFSSLLSDPWGKSSKRHQWELEIGWSRCIDVAEGLRDRH